MDMHFADAEMRFADAAAIDSGFAVWFKTEEDRGMIEEDRGRSRKIEEDRGRSRKIEEDRGDRGRSREIEEDRGRSRKIEEDRGKDRGRSRKDRGRSRKIEEDRGKCDSRNSPFLGSFPHDVLWTDNDVLRIFWADGTSVKR